MNTGPPKGKKKEEKPRTPETLSLGRFSTIA